MKKKIITAIITAVSLTMTSCGHDTDIDKSEQNTAVQESSTTASVDESATETTEQNVQLTENEQNATMQKSDTTAPVDEFIMEATSSVAVAIRVDASQYFVDERKICNKVIHGIVQEDDGFGSYLIEKHPTLKGIEYIVEFDNDYSPCNSFCYQSQEPLVSMGCSGETRKLSDWGFETWDDVLKHYDLDSSTFSVTESEQNTTMQKSDATAPADEFIMEATWAVAVVMMIEASQYFIEDNETNEKLIHGIVQEDGGFGSHLIETHPSVKGLEYIIEFDLYKEPINVFCHQSQEPLVSNGCTGDYDKLSDWGFETWEDVLNHYGLESLES